jgi:hypothetical protein
MKIIRQNHRDSRRVRIKQQSDNSAKQSALTVPELLAKSNIADRDSAHYTLDSYALT